MLRKRNLTFVRTHTHPVKKQNLFTYLGWSFSLRNLCLQEASYWVIAIISCISISQNLDRNFLHINLKETY